MSTTKADLTAPVGDLSMYIDGAWIESESGARTPVVSPGSGAKIGSVSAGTRKDAQRAILAAASAEETLRWMTPSERSAMCKRVAEALARHAGELARVIALEQGKPYHTEGKWEAGACTNFFREASAACTARRSPRVIAISA
jgi:acyl-CoA reductase-like NAD-dependent aldehyde dehydrogenase